MTMDLETYRATYGSDDEAAPGWDAIDARLVQVYPDQEPKHWGTAIGYGLGGPDPLDGISCYESAAGGVAHLHFVTYGFSSLYYDEESVGGDFSRFGFELTFRLKPFPPDAGDPIWVCNLLQNIARYVYESERWFEAYQHLPAGGPIRADSDTDMTALALVADPELDAVATPHGRVEFLQLVGITEAEHEAIRTGATSCEALLGTLARANPLWVTDLERRAG
jgi:hypothetical protein